MNNFDTIRATIFRECADAYDALAALDELERNHYTPEDMADAQAKAFRDGVASVTAGQEPVAKLHNDGRWTPMRNDAGRALDKRLELESSPSVEVFAAPVAQPQAEAVPQLTNAFLADVMTAAGLVSHGKQCKALGERLGAEVARIRTATPQQAEAVPLLSDDELAALMPPPDIDGSKARSPNAVRLAMRAAEQAARAKLGVAQEDTDRLQWLADNMMMQSGYKNTGTWALPDLPWVESGRESCLIEDLRCVIDTHIEQSKLGKEGA